MSISLFMNFDSEAAIGSEQVIFENPVQRSTVVCTEPGIFSLHSISKAIPDKKPYEATGLSGLLVLEHIKIALDAYVKHSLESFQFQIPFDASVAVGVKQILVETDLVEMSATCTGLEVFTVEHRKKNRQETGDQNPLVKEGLDPDQVAEAVMVAVEHLAELGYLDQVLRYEWRRD